MNLCMYIAFPMMLLSASLKQQIKMSNHVRQHKIKTLQQYNYKMSDDYRAEFQQRIKFKLKNEIKSAGTLEVF